MHADLEVVFDPVLGLERRPWNSYWYVYETALNNFHSRNQILLDFGCGSGITSIRFARIGYEVYGFDIAPANIRIAEARAAKYGYENRTHFSVQTAEKLNYPDEFFDFVVGIDILHHVDVKQAVLESFRVLKEGGLCVYREHIEAPIFENLRNSAIIQRLIPKEPSFSRHITPDERKLTNEDLRDITKIFGELKVRRFELFSRLDQILMRPRSAGPSLLERLDEQFVKTFPSLARFGGAVVILLKKALS